MNSTLNQPDTLGFYGKFGGAFVPELLRKNVDDLNVAFLKFKDDTSFNAELKLLLRDYVGRPTPLYFSKKLSAHYECQIFLKREDLNHTGSHKINNALGQILLAKRMGKKNIIAETGAGQHGVATATACALLDMNCIVFMGEKDIERQAPNVQRMKYLGAEVRPAKSGSKTLKDSTNEAIRYWINHPDSYYLIGSVVGPHPYPQIVAEFQSIISEEIKKPFLKILDFVNLFEAKLNLVTICTPNSFKTTAVANKIMNEFTSEFAIKNFSTHIYNDSNIEKGIIHFSKEINADLISFCTHGRTGLSHFFTGSISEDLANHALKPLIIFKI